MTDELCRKRTETTLCLYINSSGVWDRYQGNEYSRCHPHRPHDDQKSLPSWLSTSNDFDSAHVTRDTDTLRFWVFTQILCRPERVPTTSTTTLSMTQTIAPREVLFLSHSCCDPLQTVIAINGTLTDEEIVRSAVTCIPFAKRTLFTEQPAEHWDCSHLRLSTRNGCHCACKYRRRWD